LYRRKRKTFNFLEFTHICGRSYRGSFQLKRKSRRDRVEAKLKEIKAELRRRMHLPIPEQVSWLAQIIRGFFAYHAVPNSAALSKFRRQIIRLWLRTLRRRSQKDRTPWSRMVKLANDFLPKPEILAEDAVPLKPA
jgi:RNA-directed DNA polymerase